MKSHEQSSSEAAFQRYSYKEGGLKICSKFIGEHPCGSAISINLQGNFIEITFRYGCSPINLLHIFRTPFPKNTFGGLHLQVELVLLLEFRTRHIP